MRSAITRASACLAITIASACVDAPTTAPASPAGAVPLPNIMAALEAQGRPQETVRTSLDEEFVDIGRLIPGFAGFALDNANTNIVVYLADSTQRILAQQVLATRLRSHPLGDKLTLAALPLTFKYVPYSFQQLTEWKRLVAPMVREGGIQSVDADEANNRVRVGVTDESARLRVISRLTALGVPAGALNVVVAPPVLDFLSLTDNAPTKTAGFSVGQHGQNACTIGFNGTFWYGGTAYNVFLTNSHCTETFGGVNLSLPFYQPAINGTQVGTEFVDRYTFSCAEHSACRNSDAAYVLYDAGVPQEWSVIAHTTARDNTSVLTVGGYFDTSERVRFPGDVAPNTPTPITNLTLDKVGAATGWTSGQMVRTCENRFTAGQAVWLYCQDVFRAIASGGDSGAPVFLYSGSGQTAVSFAGIVFGGSPSIDEYVFSRTSRIEMDNGAITVY